MKGTQAPQKMDIYLNKFYSKKIKHVADKMYAKESEEVKAKIEKKYAKSKERAIHELGPMLDCILQYLGHITGGWKFSVLMGGHDPSTGEVSVFNYHVGELESGTQFDQAFGDFDSMQSTFLSFVKDAVAFESMLLQEADNESDSDVKGDDDSSSSSEDDSDGGEPESSWQDSDLYTIHSDGFLTNGVKVMLKGD
ncbi:hypothetical protein BDR05DRAFT_951855 [Suillus weaverae]|nr:hypothetical protein BDR05DRAFT_951855 [Suillus weaverae]